MKMAKPKFNEKRTSTFLTYDMFDRLKDTAYKKGLTVSGLLRLIIMDYLNKQNEKD
jgi:predicted DNA-binding protein